MAMFARASHEGWAWRLVEAKSHVGACQAGIVTYAQEGLQTDTFKARAERTSFEDGIDLRGLDLFLNQ